MHRDFYLFAIYFMLLHTLAYIFQTYIFFQIGYQSSLLASYKSWFLMDVVLILFNNFILLQYFKSKQYRAAYIAVLIGILVFLFQSIVSYLFIIMMMKELMMLYIGSLFISLLVTFYFAIVLLLSATRQHFWLRINGVLLILIGLLSAHLILWSLNLVGLQAGAETEIFSQWIHLAYCMSPIPYLMLYIQEYKQSAGVVKGKMQYDAFLSVSGGILLLAFLIIATQMNYETQGRISISPQERALLDIFEEHKYKFKEGQQLEYLFKKPLDYDSTQKYPLVICLHGGPQSSTNRKKILTQPAPLLSQKEKQKKYPAFLYVPQAPPAKSWGGLPFTQAVDSMLIASIHELMKKYPVDQDRLYLTGISMGGYGSWHLAAKYPDLFAAIIPMCGWGNPNTASQLVDMPIWAFHGSDDPNVHVDGSRDMIEAIRAAGGNPRYTEFEGVGHYVWPHVQDTPGVLAWLFSQEK